MNSKKIITVFGATGAQGGGVVRAILNDRNSEFSVRAITRDIKSESALALKKMGAEVITGNIDDFESVKESLKGSYGAYCVTFFWSHFSPEKEMYEAEMMARVAKEENVKHVIWSTLEDTRKYIPLTDTSMPTLNKKYKVPHFDGKGEADKYFIEYGVPTTFLLPSFYWENFIYFGMGPKKTDEGKYILSLPLGNKKMAGIASEDIGKCAYGIFKKGLSTIGKKIGVSGDQLTGDEMASEMSKHLGKQIVYNEISPDAYRNLGFPGADDLGNMFQFYRDFEDVVNGIRNVNYSKELNPSLKSFKDWLTENANRIPLD